MMDSRFIIKVRKRSQPRWVCGFLLLMPTLFGTLNELLGFPWAIRYALDAGCLILVGFFALYGPQLNWKYSRVFILGFVLFAVYTLLVYLVQYHSLFYYIWGVRNNFRFYVAFLSFLVFLKADDANDFLAIFDYLFWINALVSFIQFYSLGLKQDRLGGIFGTQHGCNGYTNIFFVITIAKSFLLYLAKREKPIECAAKCIIALFLAALAELKFFFVEFILIIVLVFLFTNFTWRKFSMVLGGTSVALIAAAILSSLFPNFSGWFTIKWFIEEATADRGYTYAGDLNRLNAIPQINELWLTTWGERLFGLGLGNCDTSSFAIVNTPFYEANGDMHYTWLSYAMMYLECGWIGLIFYFGFFVLVYLEIRKIEKRSTGMARTYCRMGRILAILCMIISVYNSSLRTEAGYMMYFALAVPFVFSKRAIPDAHNKNRDEKRV